MMEEITSRIELYHNLFTGCLAVSLLCLILAVVLFFVLDIRNVLGYLTGRQRRKKVKEMEAANAVSGRLMRERSSLEHVAPEMKTEMGVRQTPTPGARKVERIVEEVPPDHAPPDHTSSIWEDQGLKMEPLQTERATTLLTGENATALLSEEAGTALLAGEAGTSLLNEDGSTAALNQKAVRGQFLIEREIILIHTEEVI